MPLLLFICPSEDTPASLLEGCTWATAAPRVSEGCCPEFRVFGEGMGESFCVSLDFCIRNRTSVSLAIRKSVSFQSPGLEVRNLSCQPALPSK